jgi:hypothetical protein
MPRCRNSQRRSKLIDGLENENWSDNFHTHMAKLTSICGVVSRPLRQAPGCLILSQTTAIFVSLPYSLGHGKQRRLMRQAPRLFQRIFLSWPETSRQRLVLAISKTHNFASRYIYQHIAMQSKKPLALTRSSNFLFTRDVAVRNLSRSKDILKDCREPHE